MLHAVSNRAVFQNRLHLMQVTKRHDFVPFSFDHCHIFSSYNSLQGVARQEKAVETNSVNSFSSEESLLLSQPPSMQYHQLSTSQDSFLACGLDEEKDLHSMDRNC